MIHDKGIECLNVYLLIRNDVRGDELASAVGIIESLNSGIFDALELADNSLHFLEFDTETADLDLSVSTPYKLYCAVLTVTYHIAGFIASCGRDLVISRSRDRHFHKSLFGFLGLVQIADPHLRTGYQQFASGSPRKTFALFVNNKEFGIVVGVADRNIRLFFLYLEMCDIDRGLGRTIEVQQFVARRIDTHQFFTAGA